MEPQSTRKHRARTRFLGVVALGTVLLACPTIGALTIDSADGSWVARDVEAAVAPDTASESPPDALPFAPWSGSAVGGEATWLRVPLHNALPHPIKLIVEVPHAGLDEVRFVLPSLEGPQSYDAGLSVPLADRRLRSPYPAAPLELRANETAWAMIRVYDGQPSPVEVLVRSESAWERHLRTSALLIGIFLGFALLAVVWNLGQYFVTRERSAWQYAFYVATFAAYIAWWLDGEVLYLVSISPVGFEFGALALLGFTGLAALNFFRGFLDSAVLLPELDRFLRPAAFLGFLPLGAWVFAREVAPFVAAAVTLSALALLTAALAVGLRRDFRGTRFFALAWGAWAVLLSAYPLGTAGLHSNLVVFLHGPRVAFLVEIALLGLALADRLNRLKLERQEALERELQESRHAAMLGATFERFVPKQFLSLMGKESILDIRRGDAVDLELSVLFSDIRGFTPMAEALGAEGTFRFIDDYLGVMEPALAAHGGFINDIYGDGIMALFDRSADDAVAAALAMIQGLDTINRERAVQGLEPLAMAIGIHTGRLMLGTIGGETRLDCTVIGDPANLAARIEGMAGRYGATLLVSGDTRTALSTVEVTLRRLDRVQAKGKGSVIDIFEVLEAAPASVREQKRRVLSDYADALDAYLAGRFLEAAEGFRRCLDAAPDDGASALMMARAEALAEAPPADWPGHTRLDTK